MNNQRASRVLQLRDSEKAWPEADYNDKEIKKLTFLINIYFTEVIVFVWRKKKKFMEEKSINRLEKQHS